MKIAVVHDYFTQMGGAEKVAEELFNLFPEADLFATVALESKMPDALRKVPIFTSWMQHLPQLARLYRIYFPLYPLAVRSLNLYPYDLIISSSSGYAKGISVNPDAIHVCYCHTPMRWVWSYDSYSARESFGGGLRSILPAFIGALRRWDEGAARQPDHFIANSKVVADRIERTYERTAEVIAPPIDIDRFSPSPEQQDYYIILARLVPYKRIDIAVQAFTLLKKRLIVIGTGPDSTALKALAGPSVTFTGRISDAEVGSYVSQCQALIFPGEEDFGMAPLEVAAAGRPTIAFRAGGATETIIEGRTGLFFDEQTPDSLMQAVAQYEKMSWSQQEIRKHAEGYSTAVFDSKIKQFLKKIGMEVPPATSKLSTTSADYNHSAKR